MQRAIEGAGTRAIAKGKCAHASTIRGITQNRPDCDTEIENHDYGGYSHLRLKHCRSLRHPNSHCLCPSIFRV